MTGFWTRTLAVCLLAGSTIATGAIGQDRIQLRADDGKIVAVVVTEDGRKLEIIAEVIEVIEIVDDQEVTATLQVQGDGQVSLSPVTMPFKPRVRLGVTTETVPVPVARHLTIDESKAVMVSSVVHGLAAEKAGLVAYDVIVLLDGSQPVTQKKLQARVQACEAGETIRLGVIRQGELIDVDVIAETEIITDISFDRRSLVSEPIVSLYEVPVATEVIPYRVSPLIIDDRVTNLVDTQGVPIAHSVPLLGQVPVIGELFKVDASVTAQLRQEIDSLKNQIARIEALLAKLELE